MDFNQYWQAVKKEHQSFIDRGGADSEIIPRGEKVSANGREWTIDWIRFSSVEDTLIFGWVATPSDHPAKGEAFVWLPGYSYGTPPPDPSNLIPGAVTLCINVHGNQPDAPYVNPAGKADYIGECIDEPDRFIYRAFILHTLVAIDIARTLPSVDPVKVMVAGMSQGGMLALIAAHLHPKVRMCFADMPFLCNVRSSIEESRSPLYNALRSILGENPQHRADFIDTLALFDPMQHAPYLTAPIHVTAGGRDPSSPASTITPLFPILGSDIKAMRYFPDAGHIFVDEMPVIYRDWMNTLL
jgi:cephalosporin-C deacetylase